MVRSRASRYHRRPQVLRAPRSISAVIKSLLPGLLLTTVLSSAALSSSVWASPGPQPAPPNRPTPAARDVPYPGVVKLSVDATDTQRRIVRIHETVPVPKGAHEMVLLYPQWLPGAHAPEGPIDRVVGLKITAGGQPVAWKRDTVDIYAFRLTPPAGAKSIDVDFQYLSPVKDAVGPIEFSSNMATLEWISLVLYPAGYYARQIPVDASLKLPDGWSFATALDRDASNGGETAFKRAPLETVLDSPVYAGVHMKVLDLTPEGGAPVRLNVFGDRADNLDIKPEQVQQHRNLVAQAQKLFGSHHYDHYDFMFSLSDTVVQNGLEHHRSSEDGLDADYFTDWNKGLAERDLLAHEYTHSWNGKFRRPADLWTETYNTPMRDSLLWVYEGQTQYWGNVLTARSGLRTKEEALENLALDAATYSNIAGREWRPLQDTTNDEITTQRRPQSWPSQGRFLDYYREGALIWLEADTLIRERSGGKRSLDDFARGFFGIDNGSYTPVTYRFEDVVKALNAVEPYDWAAFLRERLDTPGRPAPLDGLARGGYRLVYDETAGPVWKSREGAKKVTDLTYSVGFTVGKDGTLGDVAWNGPAFKAGLASGVKIVAVNGSEFDADLLKDAITAAKAGGPIELIVKDQTRYRTVRIDWKGGLRYPHLVRDPSQPARLDDIFAAKP
ncbi:MAG: peptidase M61 [Proteobacteria bacterium]|nr:peptidase M61 [Pseudomonadota bacterium]